MAAHERGKMEALKIKEFLNIEQVAEICGCSVRYIHDEIKRGNLKAMKLGKRLKFDQSEVLKWAKKKTA